MCGVRLGGRDGFHGLPALRQTAERRVPGVQRALQPGWNFCPVLRARGRARRTTNRCEHERLRDREGREGRLEPRERRGVQSERAAVKTITNCWASTRRRPRHIKKAFRREIARYHPDKVPHLGLEFQEMRGRARAELTGRKDR